MADKSKAATAVRDSWRKKASAYEVSTSYLSKQTTYLSAHRDSRLTLSWLLQLLG